MFKAPALQKHLETAHTVRSLPKVIGEINLNDLGRIERIGNYICDPAKGVQPSSFYSESDVQTIDSTVSYETNVLQSGDAEDVGERVLHKVDSQLPKLYPIQDVFAHHRPRSGINKLMFMDGQFIDDKLSALRPRYYVSSRRDPFKYWTSYRTKGLDLAGLPIAHGVSRSDGNIDDTAPFVVYNETLSANRIVIKMQTHVGTERLDPSIVVDPFYGASNSKTPKSFKVQVLRDEMWETVYTFNGNVPADGYVELGYGLMLDSSYADNFELIGELESAFLLPNPADHDNGDAFIVGSDKGTLYVLKDGEWNLISNVSYGWSDVNSSHVIKNLIDPPSFTNGSYIAFREFDWFKGMRIVVDTMNLPNTTFDLIELSPRLVFDLTERAISFSVTKTMGDLSQSPLPVGALRAGTGSVDLSNNDFALSESFALDQSTGKGSVIAKYLGQEIKFDFSETIYNVGGYKYNVPIKTLYAEEAPRIIDEPTTTSFELRDEFFILERATAPQLVLENVSLSRAIMVLLDSIGYEKYSFLRIPNVDEPFIPYFFVSPDMSVADVMSALSEATQTAMYFDERNVLVIAFPAYVLPDANVRSTDLVLRGTDKDGALANIKDVSSSERELYNNGEVTFTKRYIQRTSRLSQSLYGDKDKEWIYSPVMVWEATGQDNVKSQNDAVEKQSEFTLSAFPLSAPLTTTVPQVVGGVVTDNLISVGESANYFSSYNGYLWANGEIIHYDAVQFSVTGTGDVWIQSADEYQNYFLGLPFNGKIYPTGMLRIYAQPYTDTDDYGNTSLVEGTVSEHGRGKFNTEIVDHHEGLTEDWVSSLNGMYQNSNYLFTLSSVVNYPQSLSTDNGAGYVSNGVTAQSTASTFSSVSSEINNPLSRVTTANDVDKLQSSAMILSGANQGRDHVSYVHKKLDAVPTSFGTRMRIIGEILSTGSQEPIGSEILTKPYMTTPNADLTISGGGGGLGILVDPVKNHGYFMELQALTGATEDYSFEDVNHEVTLGKVSAAVVTSNEVKLTLVDTPKIIAVGDTITVTEFPTDNADINGSYPVKRVDVNDVYYDLITVPYTFSAPYPDTAAITASAGTSPLPLAAIKSISIDSTGVALVTLVDGTNPGYAIGTTLTNVNFETSTAIPNINGVVSVSWVGDNEFKFDIRKTTYTFVDDLSAIHFSYKDDAGATVTLNSDEIKSATSTAQDITFTFSGTNKTFKDLDAVLAGGTVVIDRKNEFKNPRMKTAGARSVLSANFAQNPRAINDPAAAVGRWKPKVYSTTKTHGGRATQAFVSQDAYVKTTNIKTFASSTYMKGTAYSDRGWLLAGDGSYGDNAPTLGSDAYNTSLPVTMADNYVRVGLWVKASSKTKMQIGLRRSNEWRHKTKGKWYSSETFSGAVSVGTDWTWVNYGFKITPFNGQVHLRTRFSKSGSKITYYGTGLVISKDGSSNSFFDQNFSTDSSVYSVGYDTPNKRHTLSYDKVKYIEPSAQVRAMRSTSFGDTDGYSLRVDRYGSAANPFAVVDLGPVTAGRYVVSAVMNSASPDIAWDTAESTKPKFVVGASETKVFPKQLEPGETDTGVRSSGEELRQVVTVTGSGEAYLYLPATKDVGQTVFYDNIGLERIPAYILPADEDSITFFDGGQFGADWEGTADDSRSVMNLAEMGIDTRNAITSVSAGVAQGGGVFRYTITTQATNPKAQTDVYAVFSGINQLYGQYLVKTVAANTFTIDTTDVPGDTSSPKVIFVDPVIVTVPGIGTNVPMYPLAVDNISDTNETGMVTVAHVQTAHNYVNPFLTATTAKTWTETQQLFNTFFYKTVSDDRGGRVKAVEGASLTIPTHTLKSGDKVKITGTGAPSTTYTVSNLIGTRVVLSGSPTGWNADWWLGLVDPIITPFRLWAGLQSILVDSGKFYGQKPNLTASEDSVYDIGVEYSDSADGRTFFLFLNDRKIGEVTDPDPLPVKDHVALFSRGGAKVMFEHLYAISAKAGFPAPSQAGGAAVLGNQNRFDLVRRSGAAGVLQSSFLSGVGDSSGYNVFYDEFGTIFREAAYMNVKYDQAFPALIAQIAPAPAGFRGYTISGFQPTAYGAEFMVFNCTDNLLSLNAETGNYLRILGVTFTQNATHTLTIDELLERKSNVANLVDVANVTENSNLYNRLRINRMRHGDKKLSLQSDFIQTSATAEKTLTWIMEKASRPRHNVGFEIFPTPTLQLGDLVTIDYKVKGHDVIAPADKQFVVYNVTYDKDSGGSKMTVFATET